MPRARFIRPEFFTDEKIGELQFGARLLFAAIWTHADLRGVFECSPAQLKIKAFPYDAEVTRERVSEWLDSLVNLQLIVRFEAESKAWGYVTRWSRHQTFTTSEQKNGSRFPPPPTVRPMPDQCLTNAATLTLTPTLTPTVGVHARATPPPDEIRAKNHAKLQAHLRSLGELGSGRDATAEWAALMQGAGNCVTVQEVLDGIEWAVNTCRKRGIPVKYSKDVPIDVLKAWTKILEKRDKDPEK